MNALAELRKRTRTAANPANSANQGPKQVADSRDSHDSQGIDTKRGTFTPAAGVLKAERAQLLALAAAEWIDAAHVHRLRDDELADCLGLDNDQRRVLLHMMADTAERHAGRIPEGDTAAMACQHCGPVWIHPSIAAVLPEVDGWPRALGCPWCFVRKAGGTIPRPLITCSDGQHFAPEAINSVPGMDIRTPKGPP